MFTLEPWTPEHIPSLVKYADNPAVAACLRDVFPSPYTYPDAVHYVADCAEEDTSRRLTRAIVLAGEAVGSIGVIRQDDVYRMSAEIGYWLAEPFWGRGIMTEAVRRICRAVFADWDIVRIYAEFFAHNIGSRRVLEKAGFTLEGTLKESVWKGGALHDSCIYALLRK